MSSPLEEEAVRSDRARGTFTAESDGDLTGVGVLGERDKGKLEVLDEDGNSVGRQPAQRVHLEGLTHKAVYVFVFNDRGQLLLPRRPSDHWVCPDLFDISIAEHVPPGQSHREAAAAMLRHVYGLAHFELPQQPALPAHILHAELPGAYKEHVQAETYVVRGLAGDAVREAALDKSRVREAVFVDVADLQRMVEENNHEFTPWFLKETKQLSWFAG